MTKAKPLTLWALRHSVAAGHRWTSERHVTDETSADWLAEFRKSEPDVSFVVSARKPKIPTDKLPWGGTYAGRRTNPIAIKTKARIVSTPIIGERSGDWHAGIVDSRDRIGKTLCTRYEVQQLNGDASQFNHKPVSCTACVKAVNAMAARDQASAAAKRARRRALLR